MNRGSKTRRAGLYAKYTSFNEAPIHESGKLDQRSLVELRWLGFNEAPIHESGKCSVSTTCLAFRSLLQ